MNPSSALFGAALTELPKPNRSFGKLPSLLFSDGLVIIGVGLGLLLVLASGVYLFMRGRRKRRRHITGGQKVYRKPHSDLSQNESDAEEHDSAEDADSGQEDNDTEEGHSKRRYKYRVRRRSHRSRNPTLSETGGLPPAKTQGPSNP